MSLINQMLKDLEARQNNKNVQPDSPIKGLSSARKQAKPKVSKKFIFIVVPAFIILLIVLLSGGKDEKNKAVLNTVPATSSSTTVTANNQALFDQIVNQQPEAFASGAVQTSNQPASSKQRNTDTLPTSMSIDDVKFVLKTETEATLDFQLENTLHYYDFDFDEENVIAKLVFFNTTIDALLLEKLKANKFIEKINHEQKNKDLVISVNLRDDVRVTGLELKDEQTPPRMSLLLRKAGDENQKPASMTKKEVPLTPDELAENARTAALAQASKGEYDKAINSLSKLIKTYPKYLPVRESLIVLLLEHGDSLEATQLLAEGRQIAPLYVPFIVIQAKIFASQGSNDEALALLNKVSPSFNQYPEYFELLAAIKQSEGDTGVTEQIYRELVNVDPGNGKWWLGYAIALEANGKRQAAISAYRRATNVGNLDSRLQIYANSRISALGS